MRFTHGLRAVSLATFVAFAGASVLSAPVAATDPSATVTPTATPDPSATVTPAATPDPIATPVPTATADPAATATQDPAATATPDPTAAATTAPSPDPTVAPATTESPAMTTIVAQVVAPPAPRVSRAARVVRIALAVRHRRYAFGASGPYAFDCSGLVRYAYRLAGVSGRIGGGHSALGMYRWAIAHRRAGRTRARIGDVVVYGRGSHVGIYIGNGRVISALNPRLGIRITRLNGLTTRFTVFIHTGI